MHSLDSPFAAIGRGFASAGMGGLSFFGGLFLATGLYFEVWSVYIFPLCVLLLGMLFISLLGIAALFALATLYYGLVFKEWPRLLCCSLIAVWLPVLAAYSAPIKPDENIVQHLSAQPLYIVMLVILVVSGVWEIAQQGIGLLMRRSRSSD